MEQERMPWPGPGLSSTDRDTFERVWDRVTRSGGGKSPVEAVPPEEWAPMQRYIKTAAPASPLGQSAPAVAALAPMPHKREAKGTPPAPPAPAMPARPVAPPAPPAPTVPARPAAPPAPPAPAMPARPAVPPAPPAPAVPARPVTPPAPPAPAMPARPVAPPAPPAPAMPARPVVPPAPPAPAMPPRPATPPRPTPPSIRMEEGACTHCLGPASSVHGKELQAFIGEELMMHKTCMALARRTPGKGGCTFASIAADEHRHAKRLAAAYFLISGVRYWPMDRAPVRLEKTYPGALRTLFQCKQKGEGAYRAAAGRTEDPCLKELYLELAEEENAHGWLLRGLLEQL